MTERTNPFIDHNIIMNRVYDNLFNPDGVYEYNGVIITEEALHTPPEEDQIIVKLQGKKRKTFGDTIRIRMPVNSPIIINKLRKDKDE